MINYDRESPESSLKGTHVKKHNRGLRNLIRREEESLSYLGRVNVTRPMQTLRY